MLQLRPSILCTEIPKSQRTALRNFLQKYSKPQLHRSEDLKQKELSNRLTEMKKRLNRGNLEQESENFDSLLSDLFNNN